MKNLSTVVSIACGLGTALSLCFATAPAYAWGDEGHEVIGLIADHYLDPAVRIKVNALLAGDTSHLTATTQIDQEATWADKYRDSDRNTTKVRYTETQNWHYVNLEIAAPPDLKGACFGEPPLAGKIASQGPAKDCVVDKIDEFAAELASPKARRKERRLALLFILHFVGDLHQPLHASDDNDEGGNMKIVTAPGIASNKLHHDWDVEFVTALGASEAAIAQTLISSITAAQRTAWSSGTAADWADESFVLGKEHAYGLLPAPISPNHYALPASYVTDATAVAAGQLSRAGVRLAFVLNKAFQ